MQHLLLLVQKTMISLTNHRFSIMQQNIKTYPIKEYVFYIITDLMKSIPSHKQ